MADVTSVVVGATTVGANYKLSNNFTSDAGKERIISVTKSGSGNVTHVVLAAVYSQLTQAGGDATGSDYTGPDAFTIAGMGTADDTPFASGTDTVVYLRIQGNGTPNLSSVSGATLAAVCTFAPNK